MTDPSAKPPLDNGPADTAETVPDPVMTPGQRLIKALALYIFPLILLGLLIAVVIGVVRNATETRPTSASAPAAPPAGQTAPAPIAPDPSADVARLQAEVDALRGMAPQGLSQSQGVAQTLPEAAALSGLSERLDRLEAAQAQTAAAADLLRAAIALERAAQGGTPFRAELDAVDAGLDEPRLLLPLRPMADRGVPTLALLSRSFPEAAAKAHSAAQRTSAAGDPLAWLGQWLGSIVSVRRTDMTEGMGVAAILNRAEAHLRAGDLSAAITELDTLPSQARTAIKPWLDRARERLIVDETTRGITEVALSRLGANRPQTPKGGDL